MNKLLMTILTPARFWPIHQRHTTVAKGFSELKNRMSRGNQKRKKRWQRRCLGGPRFELTKKPPPLLAALPKGSRHVHTGFAFSREGNKTKAVYMEETGCFQMFSYVFFLFYFGRFVFRLFFDACSQGWSISRSDCYWRKSHNYTWLLPGSWCLWLLNI